MKVKDALAADYWIENTQKFYDENLHMSSPIMEAYEAGFEKARDLLCKKFEESWNDPKYMGLAMIVGFQTVVNDLKNFGEEDDGTGPSLYDQVIESRPKNERE